QIEKESASVRVFWSDTPLLIPGWKLLLEILLINLIKNSLEAMSGQQSRKEIEIKAESDSRYAILTVTDSGPGIKPEDKTNVFKSTFSTKGAKGTGMGLYLTSQIVQAHGGTITIDGMDSGATFRIILPS